MRRTGGVVPPPRLVMALPWTGIPISGTVMVSAVANRHREAKPMDCKPDPVIFRSQERLRFYQKYLGVLPDASF